MENWQAMNTYPDKGRLDESEEWTDEAGPLVELMMPDGRVVKAQWYGAKTTGGGEVWAWWEDGGTKPIGYYQPKAWRPRRAEAG